jgi:hypothetical protein
MPVEMVQNVLEYLPPEMLESWANNELTRSVAPLSVEEAAARATLRAEVFYAT